MDRTLDCKAHSYSWFNFPVSYRYLRKIKQKILLQQGRNYMEIFTSQTLAKKLTIVAVKDFIILLWKPPHLIAFFLKYGL